jgi:hypothetical protein
MQEMMTIGIAMHKFWNIGHLPIFLANIDANKINENPDNYFYDITQCHLHRINHQ